MYLSLLCCILAQIELSARPSFLAFGIGAHHVVGRRQQRWAPLPLRRVKGFVFDFALEALSKKFHQLGDELSGQVGRAAQQSGAQELKAFAAQELSSSAPQQLSSSAAQQLSS